METEKYTPKNKVRIVTAASLFDGHDAAINIMRRVIQATGCEVIHLGHDKSAEEVVNTAIQEDANAIALTSYQGGHNEYFKYIFDLLKEKDAPQIKIFGGGGGVILPEEIKDLMDYGIARIYSPDDGREMGLQGMINDLVQKSDFPTGEHITVSDLNKIKFEDSKTIAEVISAVENFSDEKPELIEEINSSPNPSEGGGKFLPFGEVRRGIPVIGITGTGGAGKSSLTDELVRRFLRSNPDKKIAIISVDPSKKKTGGALLGDRIRMNSINDPRVYMRSMATRENNVSVSPYIHSALNVLKLAKPDIIILETSGIGQSGSEITEIADVSLYVMTPEYGASTQLEKIDMLDFADIIVLNKSDKRGALDALQAVRKQYQRNHNLFEKPLEEMPVFSTKASQFNDWGTTEVFNALIKKVNAVFQKNKNLNINSKNIQNDNLSERFPQTNDGTRDGEPAKIDAESSPENQLRGRIETAQRDAQSAGNEGIGAKETERLIENFARENNLWTPLSEMEKFGFPFKSGNENSNYLNEDGYIYKVNNLTNNAGDFLSLFDRMKIHNQIFPNAKYELHGFTGFENSSVYPVYKQFYFENATLATEEEIADYMQNLGFLATGKEAEFSNGKYLISDLRPRNVLKTQDGDIAVIDEIIKLESVPVEQTLDNLNPSHFSEYKEQNVSDDATVIPPKRVRYLSEIVENNRSYDEEVQKQADLARQLYHLNGVKNLIKTENLDEQIIKTEKEISQENLDFLKGWENEKKAFHEDFYSYFVRGKEVKVQTYSESLSHLKIPKIALPKYHDWGDLIEWKGQENLPGKFPFTAGIYPFKRTGEDPTRMFAGEGGPERTNRRFHYVSAEMDAKRLSTAFDSVTLYGQDPALPPDIYGKIGNAGVSIATLDDAKKLYSGFDLINALTSVSMTINGPAPMLLAFFMNSAIDQNCEKYIFQAEDKVKAEFEAKIEAKFKEKYDDKGLKRPTYNGELPPSNNGLGLKLLGISGDEILPKEIYEKIKNETIATVRGTVQADILKEDQAQNTCIFSTEFALRLMGDVQEYFINNKVRNFYSVSISGYHIAEAGANPVSQLAFTLANGFTYVEYYLSRGMDINAFAPNLSFFFSNGIDPEYSVIGRVARRIWAKAMKLKYGADERSQMLKYHIQTSGRSLHAQEIDFNDIRTTLQALYAIYDNCNSLHTNAYDEAITTPTENSVRRAMAIQLIINKELGLAKNENPLQGSFIIEELTDLVEEAVYAEFDRITERGGVLGAMETMYQRSKIQEESMHYEMLKHTGEYPIIGVNTFLGKDGSPTVLPGEVIRSTEDEKQQQIANVENFQKAHADKSQEMLEKLQLSAINQENLFEVMMEAVKYCSLGQITNALFEVGGKYRRNM